MKRNQLPKNCEERNRKSEVKRRSDRAKELANDGELSKAFSMMVQRGVAPSTDTNVSQLIKKFPMRRKTVQWPRKERIYELRKLIEEIEIEGEQIVTSKVIHLATKTNDAIQPGLNKMEC